jgi:hypothetical protein
MNARLDETTSQADPVIRGIVIVTMAITIGTLALVRAAVGGRVDHVTVRVDNRAGLAVQVDALDASRDRVGLGKAKAKTLSSFQEIPDIGERWTLVASTEAGRSTGRPWPDHPGRQQLNRRDPRQRHQHARASGVPVNQPHPLSPEPQLPRRGGRCHPLTAIRRRGSA